MKKKLALILLLSLAIISLSAANPVPARSLSIYFIDTEGGASTLIVTPAGESVLVDAGFPGFDGRDAKRIKKAMDAAGVTAIDHMVATHYHADHYGGIPGIAKLVPIKHFYDHGKMTSLDEDKNFAVMYAAYQEVSKGQSATLKPGDTIPLKQAAGAKPIKLLVIAADGKVIGGKSLSKNAECAASNPQPEDKSDNARSIAMLLSYGDFEFLDNGDLTWNVESQLVCPVNNVGPIDVYQVTHHGTNSSNNPVLLRSVNPIAAIMNNGPKKGGHPDVVRDLKQLSSLKALYALHRNVASTADQNAPEDLIANLTEENDAGNMIWLNVDLAKHTFAITNGRTSATRTFSFK